MYKATNIDTDKALKALEGIRCRKSRECQREMYGIQRYYDGVETGLDLAGGLYFAGEWKTLKRG